MPKRLIATLAVALGILAAVALRTWRGGRTVQRARAVLSHAGGLREGALVTYRGVEVGIVSRVTFDTAGIAVDLAFRRPVPLRTADTATMRTLGLLGDRSIDIVPGPQTASLLPANGVLPARPPRPDISAEEWLKAMRPPPETVYRDRPTPVPRP